MKKINLLKTLAVTSIGVIAPIVTMTGCGHKKPDTGLSSIQITKQAPTSFTEWETFNHDGMVVKAIYADGTVNEDFKDYKTDLDGHTFEEGEGSEEGKDVTVTVTAIDTDIKTTYTIHVKEPEVGESISFDEADKHVVLTEDTLCKDKYGNYDNNPITSFTFKTTVDKPISEIKKIEITKQDQTDGPYKDITDPSFDKHTGIELNGGDFHTDVIELNPTANTGEFFIRFSKGVLANDCEVTFNIKIIYATNDNAIQYQKFNGLKVTNKLSIWEKITRPTSKDYDPYIFYASGYDVTFPQVIHCYGFSANKRWKTAIIDAKTGDIAMPYRDDDGNELIKTTSETEGLKIESNYNDGYSGIGVYLKIKGYGNNSQFYFVCQPISDEEVTRDEPIYIVSSSDTSEAGWWGEITLK